jgi:hypothetical protein
LQGRKVNFSIALVTLLPPILRLDKIVWHCEARDKSETVAGCRCAIGCVAPICVDVAANPRQSAGAQDLNLIEAHDVAQGGSDNHARRAVKPDPTTSRNFLAATNTLLPMPAAVHSLQKTLPLPAGLSWEVKVRSLIRAE